MILQALLEYYEALCRDGRISSPGWSTAKISYALEINNDGELIDLIDKRVTSDKKKVIPAVMLNLPEAVIRTVGINPNFLWDNSAYILGFDGKEDAKGKDRAKKCFSACSEFHKTMLGGVDSPHAAAVVNFFEHWDPDAAASSPILQNHLEDIKKSGANFVFFHDGEYVHKDPVIRKCWENHYNGGSDDEVCTCIVTGKEDRFARIHPSIKGVFGAQSSGATLVGVNMPSGCSYGKEQGGNSPTGKYAAFAYTEALNYLLSDPKRVHRIGDTSVVCWAAGGENAYENLANFLIYDDESDIYDVNDLRQILDSIMNGNPVDFEEQKIDPQMPFYILGLAPNAARVSVRFFLRNSFGEFVRNVNSHHERLRIVGYDHAEDKHIPIWRLLYETANPNSKDKASTPILAGEMFRAVLNNDTYPATLLNAVTLRIRAGDPLNHHKAAILKAYYLKNRNPEVPEEILQMSLNPNSTNIPYTLGRLFSVLEAIQKEVNPNLNTTIRDRYFNGASSTPASVFPLLINLSQKHLKQVKEESYRVHYEKQIQELCSKIGEEFPSTLNLPQQGSFQLGYYQQTQARYTSKKETEESND